MKFPSIFLLFLCLTSHAQNSLRGLRIPITHTFDVSPDVEVSKGRELDPNEMKVLVPFALIGEFAEKIGQKENFVFSREKWGVRMTATKNGVIKVRPGANNEVIWQVPVEVDLETSGITGLKMNATIEVRVRPSVEGDHLNLDVVGGRVIEVQSWPLQYGRSTVAWVLTRAFENRIKKGFPKAMVATNLPVMENVDWQVNDVRVSDEGVTIRGSLAAREKIVAQAVAQTSGESQQCSTPLLRASPNGRAMVYKFRHGRLM